MLNDILAGAHVGLGIIGTWLFAGIVQDVIKAPRFAAQNISHAWYSRPWRALSRERQTRTQGPGN